MEPDDVTVKKFLPESCFKAKTLNGFFSELRKLDTKFEEERAALEKKGKKLKFVAGYENGKATISLKEISSDHPFYYIQGKDNIVMFSTEHYKEQPLIVQGAGAGANVTAAGVFADIIRDRQFIVPFNQPMAKSIKVFAPATVANVGSGFDILGFAINDPGDEFIIKLKATPGIKIKNKTPYSLPLEPKKNTAGISLLSFLNQIGSKQGFELTISRKIKPGSGLGSSAASAIASVFGANLLLGNPLSSEELVIHAMEGEKYVTGVGHADNVGPALLGGFILIRSYSPLDIVRIPCPKSLFCSVVHPQIEVRTEDARKILKKQVKFEDAITQWGNVGGLIAGLMKSDYSLIGRSLEERYH